MSQRIVLSSFGALIVLSFLFALSSLSTEQASAMERMSEVISKATSCKVKMITEVQMPGRPGQPAKKHTLSGTFYWQAPRSVRIETQGFGGLDTVDIHPSEKSGIQIDHKTKTYRHVPARRGQMSPLMMLEGLRKYSGEAERLLGTKDIRGKQASGFVIDAKKIDPDVYPGFVEIWIDDQTHLPSGMQIEMNGAQVPMILRLEAFQWNEELDHAIFALTPPNGYTDATPEAPKLKDQVQKISMALKLYAQLSGGHYPRVKIVYGDVTRDEMFRMAGFKGVPTAAQMKNKKYQEILHATGGLATTNSILRNNADAAYFGRSVESTDKDKVLLRWKLNDGRFHVIYGDLRDETVTAQQLKNLENK